MAIVLLAHNGIGFGHLSRALCLCEALAEIGERPVLVTQGCELPGGSDRPPTRSITPLWETDSAGRSTFAAELQDYARISRPSLVIEDTHPADLSLSQEIVRILVVRPTTFAYLRRLRRARAGTYARFLLADAPSSPTWPYNSRQTRAILSWPDWQMLGPVYRHPRATEVADLKVRLRIDGRRLCVFSLGGGGQHPNSNDVPQFLETAHKTAIRLRSVDPDCRLVFVRGPYFPAQVTLPPLFEDVPQEPSLPALLELAAGAVIRPGYNAVWECIRGMTPWSAIMGTSYEEPTCARLKRLREAGLLVDDLATVWQDPSQQERFEAACGRAVAEHSGRPEPHSLRDLVTSARDWAGAAARALPEPISLRILLVAIDGVGIGHVVRCVRLGLALQQRGHEVLLVVESNVSWNVKRLPVSAVMLPRLVPPQGLAAGYLDSFADIMDRFDPQVVVYDCHRPVPDVMSGQARLLFRHRIAIASLPSRELLREHQRRNDVDITALLHSEEEFRQVYGEATTAAVTANAGMCFAGGPILSDGASERPNDFTGIPESPFLLFVFGGGGEHPGLSETRALATLVNAVARNVRDRHGLTTVVAAGPHFAHRDIIDERCVIYRDLVPNLGEYLAQATLVIARPGFNITREAYPIARALILLRTRQFEEATEENLSFLTSRTGVIVSDLCEPSVLQAVDTLIAAQFEPPQQPPWSDGLPMIVAHLEGVDSDVDACRRVSSVLPPLGERCRLLLRIDDVVDRNEPIDWILRLLTELDFAASLEVIPYLSSLTDSDLEFYDGDARLLEVSQHGYCHLSRTLAIDRKAEFGKEPSAKQLADLTHGLQHMLRSFPVRFRGGLSAPYDSYPPWLSAAWRELGGAYCSMIWSKTSTAGLPMVRVGTDVWDWRAGRARTAAWILGELATHFFRRGEAGLVLHPEHLREPTLRRRLRLLLCSLREAGVRTLSLSRAAQRQAERPLLAQSRVYRHRELE